MMGLQVRCNSVRKIYSRRNHVCIYVHLQVQPDPTAIPAIASLQQQIRSIQAQLHQVEQQLLLAKQQQEQIALVQQQNPGEFDSDIH